MHFSLIQATEGRERAAVHQRTDGPYADHQWLWRWFPAELGTPRDFLFRRQDIAGLPRFYVVSHRAPLASLGDWHSRTCDYAPILEVGQRLQFELRANPTVRHGRDGKSKRHDVVMEAKRRLLLERGLAHWADLTGDNRPALQALIHQRCGHWLQRRGENCGFALDLDGLVVESYLQHREKSDEKLQFTTVDFRGRLTVIDPQRFQSALFAGIGHAKAFGCGLLLIRPDGA